MSMKKVRTILAVTCLGVLLGGSATANAADLCIQFSGGACDLSGDLGFFRFMGAKLPTSVRKAAALHGRACGTGTATGTAVLSSDGSGVNVSATFVCDETPGLITTSFGVGDGLGAVGVGYAQYGSFALGSGCTTTIVDCATEPGLVP